MDEERSPVATETEEGDWSHTERGFPAVNYHEGKSGGKVNERKTKRDAAGLGDIGMIQ